MKPNMPNIISRIRPLNLRIQIKRKPAILHNRLPIFFRRRDPHNLHFPINISQSQMYLFMSFLNSNLNLGNFNQFLKCDTFISINIIKLMDRFDIILGDVMFRFHKLEVGYELFEGCYAIIICVICSLEEVL